MATRMETPKTRLALGLLLALGLSACGGDTPEAMQESLGVAAPTLAFVDEEHSACAGEAILANVGFEKLAADGYSSEVILADPATVEAIVSDNDSEELRADLTECFDVNGLFRDELTKSNSAEPLACDTTFTADSALVGQFLDQRFEGKKITLTIDDTPEQRDELRPCFSEAAFAKTFGVDLASDLGPAITDALPNGVSALPCAGDEVVAHFGAERLNELGVSVETAELDLGELDLEDADQKAIIEAISNCSDLVAEKTQDLRTSQPGHGACALDAVEAEWLSTTVSGELGEGRPSAAKWLLEDAVADCVVERAESVVGRTLSGSERSTARKLSSLIDRVIEDEYAATREMMDCAFYVAAARFGEDEVERMMENLFTAENEEQAWAALDEYLAMFIPSRHACEGDTLLTFVDLYRIGFSDDTIECVARAHGGAESTAALMVRVHSQQEPSFADLEAYYALGDITLDSIDECASNDEASLVQKLKTYYLTAEGDETATF